MDTTAIAALATEMSQARTLAQAQVSVMKKAIDVQAQGAMQLIAAAAQVTQAVNPPHLGNSVDTFA